MGKFTKGELVLYNHANFSSRFKWGEVLRECSHGVYYVLSKDTVYKVQETALTSLKEEEARRILHLLLLWE